MNRILKFIFISLSCIFQLVVHGSTRLYIGIIQQNLEYESDKTGYILQLPVKLNTGSDKLTHSKIRENINNNYKLSTNTHDYNWNLIKYLSGKNNILVNVPIVLTFLKSPDTNHSSDFSSLGWCSSYNLNNYTNEVLNFFNQYQQFKDVDLDISELDLTIQDYANEIYKNWISYAVNINLNEEGKNLLDEFSQIYNQYSEPAQITIHYKRFLELSQSEKFKNNDYFILNHYPYLLIKNVTH